MSVEERELHLLSVQELAERAQAQDAAAFGELYARYSGQIYNYLYRHLEGRAQEAEDLTSEVFAKVLEKIGSYQARGVPFSAWLFRVAHNHLIDHVRRRPRMPVVPIDDAYEVHQPGSFAALDQSLTSDQIKGAIGALTEEQRQVVTMRFLRGLSTAETAEAIDKSEDAVKKLQARGLATLKRSLECRSGCWRVEFDHAA